MALVAALVPLVVALLTGPRIPQVVMFLFGGVLIGPHVLPATTAALVGAGVLSVLVYPLIAVGLHRSAPFTPADAGITTAETGHGASAPPENPAPSG